MRRASILLVVGCLFALVATPAAAAGQRTVRTLSSGGELRNFIDYRPATVSSAHPPLVIVLHGGGSSGAGMESLTRFDAQADASGFVVAYPDAVTDPVVHANLWRIGCCNAWYGASTDVNFISDLIDSLAQSDGIDQSRVYVVGFSVGAGMAYRLACELSSRVAAIGSVGGYEYLSKPCAPDRPVSVYEIHGTADYYGGSCGGTTQTDVGCSFGQTGYEPSVIEVNQQWRGFDTCPSTPTTQSAGSGTITQQTWSNCGAGSSVRLDTIAGGRHCYPTVGATNCASFNATQQFWAFFAPHQLSPAPSTPAPPLVAVPPAISPGNPAGKPPVERRPSEPTTSRNGCVVPRLHGLSLSRAKRSLAAHSCKVGRVGRPTHDSGELVVKRQGVRAGSHRPAGTRISVALSVSRVAKKRR